MSGPTIVHQVAPVRLFGQIVPGIIAVKSGNRVLGLAKKEGNRTKVLSIGDQHGGRLKQMGLRRLVVK